MTDAAPQSTQTPAPTNGKPAAAPPAPEAKPAAAATPGANGHAAPAPASNEPPPFDASKAGLVYDAESQAWGRRVKVSGKEMFFPVHDEQTWSKVGLGTEAHRRMDEAARKERAVEGALAALERDLTQKDPRARARAIQRLLTDLEVDVSETFGAVLEDVDRYRKMTPEQRKAAEDAEEAKTAKEKLAALEADQRRKAEVAQRHEDLRAIRTGIAQALPTVGIDAADPHAQLLMVQRIEAVMQHTGKMPDLAEVAQWVRRTMRGSLPRTLSAASDDELLDLLGEDQVQRILARQLARQKAPPPKPAAPVRADVAPRATHDAAESGEPRTPAEQIAALRKSGGWRGRT